MEETREQYLQRVVRSAVTQAVDTERQRCLYIVESSIPDNKHTSGLELQMRNGGDWIQAIKRVINTRIKDASDQG